ncbi:monooxygenase [Histoplasma capsulatum G186AR]|uniref:Monooxygenase n=2 Tax=Ajellomyces capsulatus TaxID=5037 RepID=C0ND40_AJECG|nr:monooxygenase [Histoplasma capsulatum G186AR]EEH11581.1 monooxygenase [Histoplasma capsulatum G186AR]KAG5302579.1 monooxygenase [Histoplasma capsulatum]QSS72021.1 monooxygenase [Histoplasma capsulatum G186AR]
MASNKRYRQVEVGNRNYTEAAVVIIGAGMSGMCTAISLLKNDIHNFVIVEKSGGLGGTWRDNKYPGCCCDINSHLYSYSFEQNPSWSRLYPSQEEILMYLHDVAEKYKLFRYIRFNSTVEEARWDDDARKWRIVVKVAGESKDAEFADQYTLTSDFLVSAVGQLNSPSYPPIPGIEDFQGRIIHSARWDWTYDIKGKRVGIIGNGATAAQIIPVIAPDVAQLTVFQRTPNWVIPRLDTGIPKLVRALFQYFPPSLWRLRSWMMDMRESSHDAIADQNSEYAVRARTISLSLMKKQLPNRPELWEKLVPNYPMGCKRVIISDDYFPTFLRDNVTLETRPITEITENGINVDGAAHEFDVIVLATGFRTVEFMHPIQVYGINGRALSDIWSGGARALYGIAAESLPNFGMLYGPNTNLGHNSIILMIEAQAKYIQAMISAVLQARQVGESLKILPDPKRMDSFNDELQSVLGTTSFAHPNCHSWYKRADGRVTNNWSGTVVQYQKLLSRVRWADFILDGYGAQQLAVKQKQKHLGRVREESLFTNRAWLVTMIGLLGIWGMLAGKGSKMLTKLRALVG